MRGTVAFVCPPLGGILVALFVAHMVRERNLVVSYAPPTGLQWTPVTSKELRPPAVDRALPVPADCAANLDSQPSGAEVAVNGRVLGSTPLEAAAVPCGSLSITMRHEHYRPQTRRVEAILGTPLEITLRLRRAIGIEPTEVEPTEVDPDKVIKVKAAAATKRPPSSPTRADQMAALPQ